MFELLNAATGDRLGEFDTVTDAAMYRDKYLNPEYWYPLAR